MKRKVRAAGGGAQGSALSICDHHDVLVVGDGDFSFSYDLAIGRMARASQARERGESNTSDGRGSLVATSFDSKHSLVSKYGEEVCQNIENLSAAACVRQILHGVDATDLRNSLAPRLRNQAKFDRIVFNFPLVPLTDTVEDRKNAIDIDVVVCNRYLLWKFIRESWEWLNESGVVLITSKTCAPYDLWRIHSLGNTRVQFVREEPFDASSFQHYKLRKVNIIEHQHSAHKRVNFTVSPAGASTFAFQKGPCLLTSLPPHSSFFCNLCRVDCKRKGTFEAHCLGKKHRRLKCAEQNWRTFLTQYSQRTKKINGCRKNGPN